MIRLKQIQDKLSKHMGQVIVFTILIGVFVLFSLLKFSVPNKFGVLSLKNAFLRNETVKSNVSEKRKERGICVECIDAFMSSSNNKVIQMGEMSQGYANRIYALLNVFSLGIVTNRSVVCDWKLISGHIQPLPFKRVLLNQPVTRFLGNQTITKADVGNIDFPNLWKSRKKISDIQNNLNLYQFDANLLQLTTYNSIFFDIVLIPETMDRFAQAGLIRSEYVDAAKALFKNEINRNITEDEKIEIAYRPGFDLAHNFLKHIWRPSKRINESVNKILNESFTNGTYVIGIHMRNGYMIYNDVDPMINCAVEIEKLVVANTVKGQVRQFKWYVSTDKPQWISYLQSKYPNKIITGQGDINHIQSGTGYERAILDNEMLSLCHELIVTGGSSFSMIAAMRMGKMPLNFNGVKGSKSCFRLSLSNLGININNHTAF